LFSTEKDLEEYALTQCLSKTTKSQFTFPTPPSRSGSLNNLLLVVSNSSSNDKSNEKENKNNQNQHSKDQQTSHFEENPIAKSIKEQMKPFPLKYVQSASDLKKLFNSSSNQTQIQNQSDEEKSPNRMPTFQLFENVPPLHNFTATSSTESGLKTHPKNNNNTNNNLCCSKEQNVGGIKKITQSSVPRQLSTYLRRDSRLEATSIIPSEFDLIKMLETEYTSMVRTLQISFDCVVVVVVVVVVIVE
jgi:hypothetical protein